jgi:hypothetical protein
MKFVAESNMSQLEGIVVNIEKAFTELAEQKPAAGAELGARGVQA